jgi:hypothetical protein
VNSPNTRLIAQKKVFTERRAVIGAFETFCLRLAFAFPSYQRGMKRYRR